MHSLMHVDLQRATVGDLDRKRTERALAADARPKAPPGRLRAIAAHLLAAGAVRLDREVSQRAVA